jgi:hypothetical protein
MIMPGPTGINGKQMRYDEAVRSAILTFRDAEGIRWIRMANGTLKELKRGTVRHSILDAFGQSSREPGPSRTVRYLLGVSDAADQIAAELVGLPDH